MLSVAHVWTHLTGECLSSTPRSDSTPSFKQHAQPGLQRSTCWVSVRRGLNNCRYHASRFCKLKYHMKLSVGAGAAAQGTLDFAQPVLKYMWSIDVTLREAGFPSQKTECQPWMHPEVARHKAASEVQREPSCTCTRQLIV